MTGPRPPATQARAAFTDETGWMVVHSVHRYPGPAETVLADLDAVLRDCASFTLTYPDGLSMTEEVRITGADPWTADITVDSGALTVHDRLVLVPHGDRLSVLSVIGPESPDDALVDALADRAAELVSLP
ncbi:hypothetical protein ACFQV2_05155 [Actinokineospora soli]|uniref:Uncharacterized protein n=1 Tax=Actinokineospora soli TaxID=1048753 RepID=A0ABW2TH71_9PSEU